MGHHRHHTTTSLPLPTSLEESHGPVYLLCNRSCVTPYELILPQGVIRGAVRNASRGQKRQISQCTRRPGTSVRLLFLASLAVLLTIKFVLMPLPHSLQNDSSRVFQKTSPIRIGRTACRSGCSGGRTLLLRMMDQRTTEPYVKNSRHNDSGDKRRLEKTEGKVQVLQAPLELRV